jgi:MoaA/NifB/PqqE/SkfB family radical SAM enzyme
MNFTGGEPTLWDEDGRDLMDILIKVAEAGHLPSYNTNGSYFDDYAQCRDFFNRYFENNSTMPLRTFISMDKFHKNYDEEKGRAKSLDNIIKYLDELPTDKREMLPVHIVIIVTNDPESSLPKEMKEYYGAKGITFGDFPMMAIGKAKELTDQLPDPPDFKSMPRKESDGPGVLVLVGDDYYSGNKIIGKLGHMLDLYPSAN